jgi:predicted amino acid dehydrogenase
MVEFFTRHFWPVILSEVTGLHSVKTSKEIKGYVMTIPLTASQMVNDRPLALKRIKQALKLAEKNGVRIIGLGGLTSSLSAGGLALIEGSQLHITTGHAYTAYNVTQNLFQLSQYFKADKSKVWLAVVGAGGSIGSTSAQLAARYGFANLLLIDIERKQKSLDELSIRLKELNPALVCRTSHQVKDIKGCDFVITATNAPESLVHSEDLKAGAVVLDDAQPSDIHPDALKRPDVLVIEAGVTHTPNINSHFNYGLKDKYDNFCCMAEVLILASEEWDEHFVINKANLQLVDKISAMGEKLGFRIGEYQNFQEKITPEKLLAIQNIIGRHVHS